MSIHTVGIIGAGQMGSGIAQVCALAGLNVVLRDINEGAVTRGLTEIGRQLEKAVVKQKMSQTERDHALERITGTCDLKMLSTVDYVIEAATEDTELKLCILREIDSFVRPTAIVASNTSSISITRLGAAISHPERLVGLHFFNPVPVMSLVEVIRGMGTSAATVSYTIALAKAIGKTPINVKNSPGFVVNRILVPMINEAVFVLQEGLAMAEEIDVGMKLGANHPIGPLALADLIGLDTCLAVMQVLYGESGDPKFRPARLLVEMVEGGYLGRKTSQGFYRY